MESTTEVEMAATLLKIRSNSYNSSNKSNNESTSKAVINNEHVHPSVRSSSNNQVKATKTTTTTPVWINTPPKKSTINKTIQQKQDVLITNAMNQSHASMSGRQQQQQQQHQQQQQQVNHNFLGLQLASNATCHIPAIGGGGCGIGTTSSTNQYNNDMIMSLFRSNFNVTGNQNNNAVAVATSPFLRHHQQQQQTFVGGSQALQNKQISTPSTTGAAGLSPIAARPQETKITRSPCNVAAADTREQQQQSLSEVAAVQQQQQQHHHHAIMIRTQEVEKALHSKPQRGRKRSNLTEVERLELTRTRNREHAKTTRIRKKQRQVELEEIEKKYQDLEQHIILQRKRRMNVYHFIKIREKMLQDTIKSILIKQQQQSNNNNNNSAVINNNTEEYVKALNETIIVQNNNFKYIDTLCQDTGNNNDNNLSYIEKMIYFDHSIALQIVQSYGNNIDDTSTVSFTITSCDNVAITSNGIALVEIDILIDSPAVPIKALSFYIKFEFISSESNLISLASLTILPNIDRSRNDDHDNERLQGQVSHPSVVSLDVERNSSTSQQQQQQQYSEEDKGGGSGPGMNI